MQPWDGRGSGEVAAVVTAPRIQVVPAGMVGSLGGRAFELAGSAGLLLDEAQRAVLHGALGLQADDGWAADTVGLVVPRQNLKTTVLLARMLLGLDRCEQTLYTAHRVDSAAEVFRALVELVRASPELEPQLARIMFSNGREAIHLLNGGRVLFGTRSTSRTGRGFSLDTLIFDEAHYVSEEGLTAIVPTVSARERPVQLWFAASAVDQEVHEHGVVLARIRERAQSVDVAGLAFFEWSAALFDSEGKELRAGEVTPEMVDDERLWEQANPGVAAGRITLERLRAEREQMPHRGWIVERLCIGDYPDTSGASPAPVSVEEWRELCDPRSKRVGPLVLCFDVAPDRRAALVACGRRGVDDLLHVELLRTATGTAWLLDEVERLYAKYDVVEIVCDGYGGNVAVAKSLDDAGLKVRSLVGSEHASGCGTLLDLVAERAFRHIGQPELEQALRGAQAKPVGDAWAWSRKQSSGNVAAIVAMTLAVSAGSEIPADAGELVIY